MNTNPTLIIKAVFKRFVLVILFPVIVAGVVFYHQTQKPRDYQSGMIFYTGLVSGGSISAQGEGRVDHFAVNNAFDNLMTIIESREVIEEVALRLLVTHIMMDQPEKTRISAANFDAVHNELLSESLVSAIRQYDDLNAALQMVRGLYYEGESGELVRLINASHSFYDVDVIRRGLTVSRKRNSDMIEVLYRASDPGVCLLTLEILAGTFIAKNQELRQFEAGGIVAYFEGELVKAREKLESAEEALKHYSQENQVINYNEQTKYLAAAREDLERDINLKRASADAHEHALRAIEDKLNTAERLYLNNRQILKKRDEISAINARLAKLQMLSREGARQEVSLLQEEADALEREIIALAGEHMALNYGPEALPRTTVVNQWLTHVIELDKARAALTVLEGQRTYFDEMFDLFAPVGFNLDKLEREINIAEREYLSVLHGLNLARIRESNFEVFNTLELLDDPFFPLNPRPSRARLLVVGAFFASLFFITGLIVAAAVLDRSIRTPARAGSQTGLEVLGAVAARISNKSIDAEALRQNLFYLLVNRLALCLHSGNNNEPLRVLVFSTRHFDGLFDASYEIARAVQAIYQSVVFLHPSDAERGRTAKGEEDGNLSRLTYGTGENEIRKNIEAVLQSKTPAVIQMGEFERQGMVEFLKTRASMNVLAIDCSETWEYHDRTLLDGFRSNVDDAAFKVLACNVEPDHLEDFVASVPRKRSFLRKWVKKLLRLNF